MFAIQNLPFFVYCIFVSEIYSIFDNIRYDTGTDPNHNIWVVSSDASISYGEEYATFTKSVTGNKYASFNLTGEAVCFEFEVYQVEGYRNQTFFMITDSNYASLYQCQLQNISHTTGEWVKCRLTLDGTSITFEDAEDSTKKHTATTDKVLNTAQFSLIGSAFTELRYRNFKCYYI